MSTARTHCSYPSADSCFIERAADNEQLAVSMCPFKKKSQGLIGEDVYSEYLPELTVVHPPVFSLVAVVPL